MINKKIEKILLVSPPLSIRYQQDGSKQVKDCAPPLGLAYLAAQIKEYEVKIYDILVEDFYREEVISDKIIRVGASLEQYEQVLKEFKPDLVGVTCIFSNRASYVLDICKKTKQFNPEIITVVGGFHVTAMPEYLLKENIDFAVLGEGDYRFPKLIKALNESGELSKIDGLSYKQNQEIKIQSQTSFIKNLDTLPFPAWDIAGLEKYWGKLTSVHGVPLQSQKYATMQTSRGCPHACFYCSVPKHLGSRRFRIKSIENVMKEIRWLIDSYGVEEIHFEDNNFFGSKERAKELCKSLISNFPGLHFAVPSGSDPTGFDFELMDLLKKAGFHHLTFGLETGDLTLQGKFVDKKIDLDKIKEIIGYARKISLEPSGFFLLGFPYETKEQIQRTVDLATSLDLNRLHFAMLSPLPGSQLYDYCIENDLLYEDFTLDQVNASNTYIKNPNISREELEGIRRTAWKEYMSKRMDIKQYGISGFSEKTQKFLEELKIKNKE